MEFKEKIIIADDVSMNRDILSMMLQDRYTVLEAEDGEQTLSVLSENIDDVVAILLDLDMPKKDGFEVLEEMNENGLCDRIPVLVITSDNSRATESRCLDCGAYDFIGKPFYRELVNRRVRNAIEIFENKRNLERRVAQKTADLEKALHRTADLAKQLKKTNEGITEMLGTVVEYRNLESGEHIRRVKYFTEILGKCYQRLYPDARITDAELKTIASASALHDLGKIAIPDAILLKPGRLTSDEFEVIKTHTTKGAEFLRNMRHIWNQGDSYYEQMAIDICLSHHERWDGRGYPNGLRGDQIPLAAQLVSVADVFDALVHERCYKSAFTPEEAYRMIRNGECGAFSERILNALEMAFSGFCEVRAQSKINAMPVKENHYLTAELDTLSRVQTYHEIGVWSMEVPEGKTPRLYINEIMEKVGAFTPDFTPEETYQEWKSRVVPEDMPVVLQYLKDIMTNGASEVFYRWNHPQLGVCNIRCGGSLDLESENVVRLIGFHRQMSLPVQTV